MSGGNYPQGQGDNRGYPQQGGYPPQPQPGLNPQQEPAYPPYGAQQPSGYHPQQPYGVQGQAQFVTAAPPGLPKEAFGGFWLRVVSYFIDALVLLIPTAIIGAAFGVFSATTASAEFGGPRPNPGANGVSLLVGWFYFAFMEIRYGGTLGKLALGLRVVDENGMYLGLGRASGRYFSKILSGCLLFIGYIMIGFHEQKRGLHDLIAQTYVVRKEFINPAQSQQ